MQENKKGAHSDDVQNAEQAVDTVSWKHVLHHWFSTILKNSLYLNCEATYILHPSNKSAGFQ